MLHWLRYGAGWWLGFLPVYLLLANSLSWQEVVAGTILAGIAALAVTVTCRAGALHFQPRWRWLRFFRRLPSRVPADCAIMASVLVRTLLRREKIEGAFRTIPFDPGGNDAESAARRALVVVGAGLTPNTYVVAVDVECGQLLIHQLVPLPQLPGMGNREWLI